MVGLFTAAMLATSGVVAAFPSLCSATPPPIEDPTSGDAAVLDPGMSRVNDASRYGQRGYAGLSWSTYDTGCIGDFGSDINTWAGNLLLGTAVESTAAWQGLASLATSADLSPTATAAGDTATALWGALFTPWAGVAVTVSALVMLVAAGRAETSRVLTRAALNIVALGVASLALGGSGVSLANDLRAALGDAIGSVQAGVASQLHTDPIAGPRNLVVDQLLWASWKSGEVGPTGTDQLAETLYENQSLTKAEAARIAADPPSAKPLFEQKHQVWQQAAAGAQTDNPAAYQSIQGRGSSRFGAGARALFMVAPIAWFQVLALFLVLGLLVFCALLPIGAPLIGLAAVAAPGVLGKSVQAAGMVIGAGLASAFAAVVQIALATRLLGAAPTSLTTSLILLAVTIVARRKLKPLMSVSGALRTVTGAPSRAATGYARYRALRRLITAQGAPVAGARALPGGGGVNARRPNLGSPSPNAATTARPPAAPRRRSPPPGQQQQPAAPRRRSPTPGQQQPGGRRRRPTTPAGHAATGGAARASRWPRTRPATAAGRAGWWTPPGAVYWPPPRPAPDPPGPQPTGRLTGDASISGQTSPTPKPRPDPPTGRSR